MPYQMADGGVSQDAPAIALRGQGVTGAARGHSRQLRDFLFTDPVEIGDRLSTTGRLVEISDFKRTQARGGLLHQARNQLLQPARGTGQLAPTPICFPTGARARPGQGDNQDAGEAFQPLNERDTPSTMEDQAPMDPPEGEWLQGGWHNGTEEMLESWRTGWQGGELANTRWDDVKVGDSMAPLLMPITVTRCVFMASASRDFAPQHHNTWYCHNKSRTREMFLGTHFNLGMLSRFMTDYGGPLSTVRRIQLQMKRTIGAGEDYMMSGVVIRKWAADGENLVDMEISIDTQLGPAYSCTGTLALP